MKKISISALIIFICIFLLLFFSPKMVEDVKQTNIEKPPIVDHFACSDYCPGPTEKYTVKVYQGIEDDAECLRIGGRPSSYTGWMVYKICLAQ